MKQQISYQMDSGLNAQQTLLTDYGYKDAGDGPIPVFFDNVIHNDIAEKVLSKRWTLEQYGQYVATNRCKTYLGINKFLYEKTIDAIRTIVYAKKQGLRQKPKVTEAIAYLHQDMKLSPGTIQRILLLFGVKLETRKILEESNEVFATKPMPKWLQHVVGN